MNKYKDNHEFYRSTFDKVHASDELLRKVQTMNNTETKKKVYAIRKVLYIAAAIIIVFAASNAVVYAATGETWIEKVMVQVIVNGNEQNVLANKFVDEDGNTGYIMEFDNDDPSDEIYFSVPKDENIEGDNIGVPDNKPATLTEEDGKVYFNWSEEHAKIDITDDFKDGKAQFLVTEKNGKKIFATVEGTIDEYTIILSQE